MCLPCIIDYLVESACCHQQCRIAYIQAIHYINSSLHELLQIFSILKSSSRRDPPQKPHCKVRYIVEYNAANAMYLMCVFISEWL